jgi:RNA ligase (TIGR02306 family)
MSAIVVEVVEIKDIVPHPDADTLEIAQIKAWASVIRIGQFKKGDLAVYVPLGAALPQDLIDELEIAQFLKRGEAVRAARLRGIVSNGLLLEAREHHKLGDNVADEYSITKWDPPALQVAGAIPDNPNFKGYSDLHRYNDFPDLFKEGERVRVREKIHGTNSRYAILPTPENPKQYQYCVGGHNLSYDTSLVGHTYIEPAERLFIRHKLLKDYQLFGEVYGAVQDLKYGLKPGQTAFVAFDLIKNLEYVNDEEMEMFCNLNGIPVAPLLYDGPFSHEKMVELANLKSTLAPSQISEGIVIKSAEEGYDLRIGRKILKLHSDAYLTRKGGTEYH